MVPFPSRSPNTSSVLNVWLSFCVVKSGFNVIWLLSRLKLPTLVLSGNVQCALSDNDTDVCLLPRIWWVKRVFTRLKVVISESHTSPAKVALSTVATARSLTWSIPVWVALWVKWYRLNPLNMTLPTTSASPWTSKVALSDALSDPLIFVRSMLRKALSDKVWLSHFVSPVQSERSQMKFACLSVTPNVALASLLNCQLPLISETFRETTALPPLMMKLSALNVRFNQSSSCTTSPCGRPINAGRFWWL